jgi:HAD superfamily hydrolase (TIGR01509 family)
MRSKPLQAARKGYFVSSIRALLFDMDGTLAATDPLHAEIFAQVLAPHGFTVDHSFYAERIAGQTNRRIFQNLFPGLSDDEADAMSDAKEAAFRAAHPALEPLPGLLGFIAAAVAHGLHLALVTNAPRANADHVLEALGLTTYFAEIVTVDVVPRGKPYPDPYQEALRRFGLAPHQAIAFEDSPTGLRAALAAGVPTVGLATTLTVDALRDLGARWAAPDYLNLSLPALLAEAG